MSGLKTKIVAVAAVAMLTRCAEPPPFSEVRELTDATSNTPGLAIKPDHLDGRYKLQDALVVEVTPPAKLAHSFMMLDFVESDGSFSRLKLVQSIHGR